MTEDSATVEVTCPYCGEHVEVFLEADVRGEMVVDCEVCCNPWYLRARLDGENLAVEVSRLDD